MFSHNDILLIKKYKPFDLMRKSIFDGVKLEKSLYLAPDNERRLFRKLMQLEKFKNVKIDESIIDLIIHTDNSIAERKLFYPAFFLDNDFDLGRFIVKGVMVFESHTIERVIDGDDSFVEIKIDDDIINDIRVHFSAIDIEKDGSSDFNMSIKDYGDEKYGSSYKSQIETLPEYENEKDVIKNIYENVGRIVCNIIDMVEGNKEELDIKIICPAKYQNIKKMERKKPITPTIVIIRPKKQLLDYIENFEREYKKSGFSHKFIVRGHWRNFRSEFYKNVYGGRIWIKPFIKGHGIFIKKDAIVES